MFPNGSSQQFPAFGRTEAPHRPSPMTKKYRSIKDVMKTAKYVVEFPPPAKEYRSINDIMKTIVELPPPAKKYSSTNVIVKTAEYMVEWWPPPKKYRSIKDIIETAKYAVEWWPRPKKYRSIKDIMETAKYTVEWWPPPKKYRSIKDIMETAKYAVEWWPPPKKYLSIEVILKTAKYRVTQRYDYSQLVCEQCRSGERDEELLLCDMCDKGFHMACARPVVVRIPLGPWHCFDCSDHRPLSLNEFSQTKIINFFGIREPMKCITPQVARRRRKQKPLVLHKTPRRLRPYIPTEDSERRMQQMASLAAALTSLGLEFSDELTYLPGMAPRSANKAEFESGGVQVLSKEDTQTMEHCINMYKRGKCPPLMVVFDSCEGYTVEVDGPIKPMTFITEYTGDVDYIKNRENDDCDSMMTLLLATGPSDSLVICPDKRGNIARFINGINNRTRARKPNLKCVRYSVHGECRVFLVAARDIAKGERLYYDYNGYENAYPTDHFV